MTLTAEQYDFYAQMLSDALHAAYTFSSFSRSPMPFIDLKDQKPMDYITGPNNKTLFISLVSFNSYYSGDSALIPLIDSRDRRGSSAIIGIFSVPTLSDCVKIFDTSYSGPAEFFAEYCFNQIIIPLNNFLTLAALQYLYQYQNNLGPRDLGATPALKELRIPSSINYFPTLPTVNAMTTIWFNNIEAIDHKGSLKKIKSGSISFHQSDYQFQTLSSYLLLETFVSLARPRIEDLMSSSILIDSSNGEVNSRGVEKVVEVEFSTIKERENYGLGGAVGVSKVFTASDSHAGVNPNYQASASSISSSQSNEHLSEINAKRYEGVKYDASPEDSARYNAAVETERRQECKTGDTGGSEFDGFDGFAKASGGNSVGRKVGSGKNIDTSYMQEGVAILEVNRPHNAVEITVTVKTEEK